MNRKQFEQAFAELPESMIAEAAEAGGSGNGKRFSAPRRVFSVVWKIAACLCVIGGIVFAAKLVPGKQNPVFEGTGILQVRAVSSREVCEANRLYGTDSVFSGCYDEEDNGLHLFFGSTPMVAGADVRYEVRSDGVELVSRSADGALLARGQSISVRRGEDVLWSPWRVFGEEPFTGERDYLTVLTREEGYVTGITVLSVEKSLDGGWSIVVAESKSFPLGEDGYQNVTETHVSEMAEDVKREAEPETHVPALPEETDALPELLLTLPADGKAGISYRVTEREEKTGVCGLEIPGLFAADADGRLYYAQRKTSGGGLYDLTAGKKLASFDGLSGKAGTLSQLRCFGGKVWMLATNGLLYAYDPSDGALTESDAIFRLFREKKWSGTFGFVTAQGLLAVDSGGYGFFTVEGEELGRVLITGENRSEDLVTLVCGEVRIDVERHSGGNQTFSDTASGGVLVGESGSFAHARGQINWSVRTLYDRNGDVESRLLVREYDNAELSRSCRVIVAGERIEKYHTVTVTLGETAFANAALHLSFDGEDGTHYELIGYPDRVELYRLRGSYTGETAKELESRLNAPARPEPHVPAIPEGKEKETVLELLVTVGTEALSGPDPEKLKNGSGSFLIGKDGRIYYGDGTALWDLTGRTLVFRTADFVRYDRAICADLLWADGKIWYLMENGISLMYDASSGKTVVRDGVRRQFKRTTEVQEVALGYYRTDGMELPLVVTDDALLRGGNLFDTDGNVVEADVLLRLEENAVHYGTADVLIPWEPSPGTAHPFIQGFDGTLRKVVYETAEEYADGSRLVRYRIEQYDRSGDLAGRFLAEKKFSGTQKTAECDVRIGERQITEYVPCCEELRIGGETFFSPETECLFSDDGELYLAVTWPGEIRVYHVRTGCSG